jgi:hypothetical protein
MSEAAKQLMDGSILQAIFSFLALSNCLKLLSSMAIPDDFHFSVSKKGSVNTIVIF